LRAGKTIFLLLLTGFRYFPQPNRLSPAAEKGSKEKPLRGISRNAVRTDDLHTYALAYLGKLHDPDPSFSGCAAPVTPGGGLVDPLLL
jgi:hypothetical protein